MKAYGIQQSEWREDKTPPSKHAKIRHGKRQTGRRLLHKKGRSQQRSILTEEVREQG